ncbi:MAG TPA: MarR family winged helix-turn-helix transcriptional regulator [Candidatus Saccharimonadales bacterium]|nr:MarR family winged helix-turn-helix transcriptional regulator [Candidatus Saccharimonadales bacterium]
MHNENISTNFYTSLLGFLLTAKQHLISIGAQHGLTSIQAITLMLLEEHTDCPMKRLGQVFHCDASNITGIVDGLERKMLVSRESDQNDRRIKTVRISAAGRELRDQMLKQLIHDSNYLFGPLSDTESRQLVHIIEKLNPHKKPA